MSENFRKIVIKRTENYGNSSQYHSKITEKITKKIKKKHKKKFEKKIFFLIRDFQKFLIILSDELAH